MATLAEILARGRPPEPKAAASSAMDFIVRKKLQHQPELRSEIHRICNIPIAEPYDDDEIDAIQQLHVKPAALERGFRLQRVQAEAIFTYQRTGSLFAPVEVGGGKTLIALRCVGIAFENGLQRVMLCVPPQVLSQLVDHDIAWARQRTPLGCTFFNMGGRGPAKRRSLAGGRRGCWIMPYSCLSTKDTSELLELIKPQLIVLDEAHNLKNRHAARTRRLLSYCDKYNPQVVALSGTMTARSIKDYAHLLMISLKELAPVPFDAQVVSDWAATIDSERGTEAFHDSRTTSGPLRPLINWANQNFPGVKRPYNVQGFRWAFRDRLLTSPGVISSPADALGTGLIIENRRCDAMKFEGGARLKELFDQLENEWLSPGGDEIDSAMMKYKWATELSAGIYNDLVWPEETPENAETLKLSKDHHLLQQHYHKTLRHWFNSRSHKPGLDTPMLVGSDMKRNGPTHVGGELYAAWADMKNAEFDDMLSRLSVPVRVCDYKLQAAVQWMKKHPLGEGIVWYYHHTCGDWLVELAEAAGLSVIHCPAGAAVNKFLTSPDIAEQCKGKFLICSIKAHGTGKNLQFLTDQLYVQFPFNESAAQQAIGRTHRKGQEEDTVTVTTLISNDTDELALSACLNDAVYVYETLQSSRKVLVATWNPMPTIYGTQVLQRAGLQTKVLNAKQQMMLAERFTNQ